MQKFIFVITSILILCLIGCSDVVGQGTGGAQDVITNQENNSASTNNEYDSPEREIEMLKMQNLDLDQYNKQLRSDIEKMQKDIQQEQMINNILQEDITNLSNELQKQQQTMHPIMMLHSLTIIQQTSMTIQIWIAVLYLM